MQLGIFTISLLAIGFDERKDTTVQKSVVLHRQECTLEDAQRVTNFHTASVKEANRGNYLYVFQPHHIFLGKTDDWVPEREVAEPAGISIPVFPRKGGRK